MLYRQTQKSTLFLCGLALLVVLSVIATGAVLAMDYPERDIRVIVPYKPGGGSDVRARLVEKIVREKKLLPHPFVVTNMPGGGAAPGQREVLRAKPDGYTILLHHGQVIIGHLLGILKWNYDAFAPIAQITENPLIICTHKDRGWKTFEDLIAAAKKDPGTITWSWGGMGGHGHFTSEAIFSQAGIRVRPVAHGGAAESKVSLAGKQIDIAIFGVVPLDYIKSGDFVPLAVTADGRMPQLPDVPTLKEKGVDVSISIRYSFFAPKKTPEPILKTLRDTLKKVTETAEYKEKIEKIGAIVKFRPGQEMFDQFGADAAVFQAVVEKVKKQKKK